MARRSGTYSALDQFERKHVTPNPGRTLVVGSHVYEGKPDRRKLYAEAVGVDMIDGPGVDVVADLEGRLPARLGKFDHVECMSVLEHSRRPWLLAANLERLLKPGGTLFVSVPFVWRIHGYPSDYWRMTPAAVKSIFPRMAWLSVRLVTDHIQKTGRLAAMKSENGHPYLARCETCGFGRKATDR
jgi:SAM-dependent methyltransferase